MTENLALPGNPRYQPKSLQQIFGYDHNYVPVAEVELAGMQVLAEIGVLSAQDYALLTPDMEQQIRAITATIVDDLERKVTHHDIRALVRLIQDVLPPRLQRWVHVPFTSYDPLETGRILQYCGAHEQVVRPKAKEIGRILAKLVKKYAKTLQIGRTHGQHALPITVGFWLATLLSRIMFNAGWMDMFQMGLVGKISGAVGCSNAVQKLGIAEKCGQISFQDRVLDNLGLKPAVISTQILPPEPLAYFLFSNAMLAAAFGQLGRDCRHLMRSEIAEIGEPFGEGQVGSSTMAQKRNPINFENLEGMWLGIKNEFGKVLDALISEHQRDLVGSSLARDFPTIIVKLVYQMETLLREDKQGMPFLERMTVNEQNCLRNFQMSSNLILAEPIYIALQMAGYMGDAHELVNRKAMPLSQRLNVSLLESVKMMADEDSDLRSALEDMPQEVLSLLDQPEKYIGNASVKALEIAELAESFVKLS